ncbi:Protein BZZ1, partial [Smittium mucronatum]
NFFELNEIRTNNTRDILKSALLDEISFNDRKSALSSATIALLDNISAPSETSSFVTTLGQKQLPAQTEFIVSIDTSSGESPNLETDSECFTILSNILTKARSSLATVSDAKAAKIIQAGAMDSEPERLLLNSYIDIDQSIIMDELSEARYQAVISCISQAIGDVNLSTAHSFKPYSFKIPTACGYCGENIWGLSKGVKCEVCGYCCHTKCELKVKPDCQPVGNGSQSGGFLSRAFRRKKTVKKGTDVDFASVDTGSAYNYSANNSQELSPDSYFPRNSNTSGLDTASNYDSANPKSAGVSDKHDSYKLPDMTFQPSIDLGQQPNVSWNGGGGGSAAAAGDEPGSAGNATSDQIAVVLYSYQGEDGSSMAIDAGDELVVIEPD